MAILRRGAWSDVEERLFAIVIACSGMEVSGEILTMIYRDGSTGRLGSYGRYVAILTVLNNIIGGREKEIGQDGLSCAQLKVERASAREIDGKRP